jgi:hypothetical protein
MPVVKLLLEIERIALANSHFLVTPFPFMSQTSE